MFKNIILSVILGISIPVLGADLPGDRYTQLFGFHLNKTFLREIQSKLGNAPVITSGDAATSSSRINYYFEKNDCYVIFNSDEMGGGEIVTDFILASGKPKEKFYVKKNINLSEKDLGGLRLGMTVEDVKKILGDKVKIDKNGCSILFTGKRAMTEDEIKRYKNEGLTIGSNPYYRFIIRISCKFADDKTYRIVVYKTEQN